MKLPPTATIDIKKVRDYFLAPRKRNDKSKWLARAGYIQQEWYLLEQDLRDYILPLEADFKENTDYGEIYTIDGPLKGPNGKILNVRTVWMVEKETKVTKLITMYPLK